jgi:hypothetical protein
MINSINWGKFFGKHKCTETEEKERNPQKPLNYFEFVENLKKMRINLFTGKFPMLNIGQFKVSLQAGNKKIYIPTNDKVGTLAEYLNFEFSVIDENGKINFHMDRRFINMLYRDYYFSTDKHNEKVIIDFSHVFEILSYIEQMDVEADSYRNKKYYIRINTVLEKVELIEATDIDIIKIIGTTKFNQLDLKIEKYVGIYDNDESTYIVVRREYSFKGKYKYFAIYPKEIEDIIRLTIHYQMFAENIKYELIRNWSRVNQSQGIIYKSDWNTWINEMKGEFFDCSANQLNLNNWINKKGGLPLALHITEEGRVEEIYGNRNSFEMYFSALDQNYYDILGIYNDRKYIVQHYNWTPNPDIINRYMGNAIYGDAIVMCEENNKAASINADDLKLLFDMGHIAESLKKRLFEHINNELFNEDYRAKKRENSLKSEKEKIVDKAKSLNLADGIYMLVRFNERARLFREAEIDIYEVFPSESKKLIDSWIYRVNKLLTDNYDVGDKFLYSANLSREGDRGSYEIAHKRYEEAYLNFIKNNPGFNEKTYSDAIHQGVHDAR